MPSTLTRYLLTIALSGFVSITAAQGRSTAKPAVNLPPPVELQYDITAKQKGLTLAGEAVVKWNTNGKEYDITTETRAMLAGKILEARSEGKIDKFGLAPDKFQEKRFRKAPTTTTFDRAAKVVRYDSEAATSPLQEGEQDRSSVAWQLVSVARATPAKFTPGSEWRVIVAGRRDADPWVFKVVKQENIHTEKGDMSTLHFSRQLPGDSRDDQLDIWLAPDYEWYPVRLRFSEDNGDYIEQTLKQANKK